MLVAAGRRYTLRRFTANDTDWGNRNYGRTSDIFVEKADYLCLRDVSLVVAPEGVAAQTAHKRRDAHRLGQHALLLDGRARVSPEAATTGGLYTASSTTTPGSVLPADAQSALHGQTHVLTPYCHENEIRKDYSRSRAALFCIRGGRLSRRPGHHAGQALGQQHVEEESDATSATYGLYVYLRSALKSMNDVYLCWGELRNLRNGL